MPVMAVRPPAVTCHDCGRSWNSASLAEGLRLLGSCPRCGGRLAFRDAEEPVAARAAPAEPAEERQAVEPHLVLGIPRR
jgi:predicted  nucleic acid-binding Zn-ribbon protein